VFFASAGTAAFGKAFFGQFFSERTHAFEARVARFWRLGLTKEGREET
jgi:hypothetical protein